MPARKLAAVAEQFPWYCVVQGRELAQGDLVDRCPVLVPKRGEDLTTSRETELQAEIREYDVVIISQSCDLATEKLDFATVCPHGPLEEWAEQHDHFKSKKGKEDLRRGNLPGFHLLHQCEISGQERGFRVVNFREVFAVPIGSVVDLLAQRNERLRLLPPYREHLAQAFARFFMRVGLPADIPPFAVRSVRLPAQPNQLGASPVRFDREPDRDAFCAPGRCSPRWLPAPRSSKNPERRRRRSPRARLARPRSTRWLRLRLGAGRRGRGAASSGSFRGEAA